MLALLSHSTGMPSLDASSDFRRARRARTAARAARWLGRRRRGSGGLQTLSDRAEHGTAVRRLEVVALDAIVGTLDPTADFDARFRPTSDRVRSRWERIALAHRRGAALPPVELLRRGDAYYVVDGRHRVSVAIALGHEDIDAWVTGTAVRARPGRRPECSSCG